MMAAAAGAPFVLRGRAAGPRPNVLFMAIDDLNDWIGCMGGHPQTTTPNLDRLAKRGVLFTNAHCAAPLCNPSRAALMTGIRPSTSGIYDNNQPMRKSPALKNVITLPQHFAESGYRVIGGRQDLPRRRIRTRRAGRSTSRTRRRTSRPIRFRRTRRSTASRRPGTSTGAPMDVPDTEMGDYKVASWASGELSRKQDKPFFLACGIFRPHLPWYVPPKYFDMHPLKNIQLPKVNERRPGRCPGDGQEDGARAGRS